GLWCILRVPARHGRERSVVGRQFARSVWLCIGVVATGLVLFGHPAAAQLFRPFSSDSRHILEGNWQSCRDNNGNYAERVYDHLVNGVPMFEVHMGPRREFAIFKGIQDAHRDHESADNLLKPFRVAMDAGRAKQHWDIPSLNLAFTVTLAGGSRTDCESWFVLLEPLEKTSH